VLPVQEDETGLVLWALWRHYAEHRSLDFIGELYTSLIVPAADWMSSYVRPDGLPQPSWDLWEERWGIHAFTVGAVWGGLEAACRFAELFSDLEAAGRYRTAADRMRAAADAHLYRPELGRFARRLVPAADGYQADEVLDSSLYGLWRFGMYPADEPGIVSTMGAVADGLLNRAEAGGIGRYSNDYYFQAEPDVALCPGNPWFICTLWLAQWRIATARTAADLAPARAAIDWTVSHRLPGGLLSEQLHPHSGAPLSVSPLVWSHAELVRTVDEYLGKVRELGA
jgi:GH15 family glucan-1,4-alpha-glucosidase